MAIYFDKTTIKTGNSGQPVINEGENLDGVLEQQDGILDNQDQLIEQLEDILGTKLTGGPNIDLMAATATPDKVLAGETFFAGETNEIQTGNILSKEAEIITPSTTDYVITAGQYLSGDQTILGDADLIAENIKSGVNIFGVNGTYNGASRDSYMATGVEIIPFNETEIRVSGLSFWPEYVMITATYASEKMNTYTISFTSITGSERISWVDNGNLNITEYPIEYPRSDYSFSRGPDGFTLNFKYLNAGYIDDKGGTIDRGEIRYFWIALAHI